MNSKKCRRLVSWLFIVAMVLGLVFPGQQPVLAEGTEEEVTFPVEYTFVYTDNKGAEVRKTGSFQTPDEEIGLNEAIPKKGEAELSDYFIGWSDSKDYIEDGQGHLFFNTNKVSDLINAGIKPGSELYEMRANGFTLITGYKSDLNKIAINDQVPGSDFVSLGNPEKVYDEGKKAYQDKTVVDYLPGVDYKINRLDAVFSMNPFLQAAIYKNAWVGAFDNTSSWGEVNKVDGKISVVDLHVSFDKRLELPDEFDIAFTSYSFYPIKIYSARDPEGNLLDLQDNYIDIGADPTDLYKKVQDGNPTTTFRTKSYIEDAAGNKVRVYDYVIRTRMRNGHTPSQAKKIVPATMEQIQSDMVLSLAGGSFTVKNEVAKEIAQGGEPIKISGSITAQQPVFRQRFGWSDEFAYKIPITESEVEELDFKGKTPDPQPQPQPEPQPKPEEKPEIERIGGKDRDDTSRKIADRFFGQSKYVIVARNDEYPDALTASLLARILDCPILLNNPKYLEKETKEEIIRLGAKDIILVGQENALSKEVKTELDKLDQDKAERIGGEDRYETSALLAKRVAGLIGGVDQAIMASGEDFPDALASAPLSGKKVAPILLTQKESLPKSVDAMIKELKIKTVDIAGGNKAVATSLEKALPKLTKRYDGDNRYDTAALIANDVRTSPSQVYLASGEVFPDALTIGPVAAKTEDPILLSRKSVLPKETQDYMKKHKLSKIFIIGGTDRLDLSLEKDILDIVK